VTPARLGLAALLVLTACEGSVDRQRATTCRRAVPALAPAGTTVRILRIGMGATPDQLRVDYAVAGQATLAARQRWVTCGFGPGAELLVVSTEQGPMTGAALHLLKHFYLDTPEAEAADPDTAKP
jgi:hypothetical protein